MSADKKTDTALTSRLYSGKLRHRRFMPTHHSFTYDVALLYINLDESDTLSHFSRIFSTQYRTPMKFCEEDYIPSEKGNLRERVLATIEKSITNENNSNENNSNDNDSSDKITLPFSAEDSIFLLTQPRYFGFSMNPISCFYYFDKQKKLRYMVAEVTNTPWKERICYVIPCATEQEKYDFSHDKNMHVSPFNPMEMHYRFQFTQPNESLVLHLSNLLQDGYKTTDATLRLSCEELTPETIRKIFFRFPFQTLGTAWRIYWHALRLKLKGVPFYRHPLKNHLKSSSIKNVIKESHS